MPITNDEGAYLYDALHITRGVVPYRDFLTKAPLLLYSLAAPVGLLGRSIVVGRMTIALASALTALLLYGLSKELYGRRVGLLAGGLWALHPTVAVFTAYIHTQPYQVLFLVAAAWLFVRGWREESPRKLVAAGAILGLGFLVRQTALAMLAVAALTLLTLPVAWTRRVRAGLAGVAGFLGVVGVVVLVALPIIGPGKTLDLLGSEQARQAVDQKTQQTLWEMLTFVGRLLREALAEAPSIYSDGWLLTLLTLAFVPLGVWLWRSRPEGLGHLPLVWLAVLVGMYAVWIKFRTPYYVEFLPPMTLASAAAAGWIWRRLQPARPLAVGVGALVLVSLAWSFVRTHERPYTGGLTPALAREAADYLASRLPPDQPVLTAQVIVPFLSGHPVVGNITHPAWYAYANIDEETLTLYFPPFSAFQRYVEESGVPYVLVDDHTRMSYFRLHPQFEAYIMEAYQIERRVDYAPGSTLLIMRRVD